MDPDAFGGTSITAIATACHEAGHAIQFAQGYAPMKIRGALVPAVNFASNAWVFLLMFGIFMQLSGLTTLAHHHVRRGGSVPAGHAARRVRCIASRLAYLKTQGISQAEQGGAYSVLRACALTYVAAALTSSCSCCGCCSLVTSSNVAYDRSYNSAAGKPRGFFANSGGFLGLGAKRRGGGPRLRCRVRSA